MKASWKAAPVIWMGSAALAAVVWSASGCGKDVSSSNDHSALSRILDQGLWRTSGKTRAKSESRCNGLSSICGPRNSTTSKLPDLLKRELDLKILVVGHTDNVGGFESNRDLSQRRAESVVNALVTGFGIARDRLVPFGVSYAAPVASNATAEGRSNNRRVELVRY